MSNAHIWAVFGRVRIGTYVAIGLLDLALAVIGLVILLSGWSVYDSLQRALSLVVFVINLLSTLGLILLAITRLRPMVDLGCVFALLLVQIGSLVTYILAAPSMPCSSKGLLESCKGHTTFVLYGSCASCALLCIFLLFLFPMLRRASPLVSSQSSFQTSLPRPFFKHTKGDSFATFSDTASSLTYCSWDRNPEKQSLSGASMISTYLPRNPKKHQSTMSQYSQASFGNHYSYSLDRHHPSPHAPKPLTIVKKGNLTMSPPHPLSQAASPATWRSDLPPGALDENAYLRPYTPPPVDRSSPRTAVNRASVASQDTSYAASWLMEPPRAALSPSAPKLSSSSIPKHSRDRPYPSTIVKPPRSVTAKMVSVKKHRPGMLTLDTFQDSDSVTISDVPRSPSPVETYSPRRGAFPQTPRSGVLPKHPRLTMHMREASQASYSPYNSPRM